jgi:S1-C subfamily serine protease
LKGSPAAAAGLRGATHELTLNGQSVPLGGDTLLAIDGKGVTTAEQLADTIAARRPGDRVKLTVVRARKRRTVTVKLGNAPSQGP